MVARVIATALENALAGKRSRDSAEIRRRQSARLNGWPRAPGTPQRAGRRSDR